MSHVLMANTSLFFRVTEYQYAHGVGFQHKRSQITLDTIRNMTDSNDADTDADEQTTEHRLPFQSVAESDTLWVCLDTLQKMTKQFEDESDENSETINRQLRDAQIALQKAKNARRQALIFDRVYDKVEQDELQVDEYELEDDNDLE
ncbi:hypothetical protein OSG_eHP24_00210 [environmental Halophage eHP-24]|nr:hypothetical protein OSG_eHP24_00210 [environmental Halophage eHP-24]